MQYLTDAGFARNCRKHTYDRTNLSRPRACAPACDERDKNRPHLTEPIFLSVCMLGETHTCAGSSIFFVPGVRTQAQQNDPHT